VSDAFDLCNVNVQVLGNAAPHVHPDVVGRCDSDPAPSMPLPAESWVAAKPVADAELAGQLERPQAAIGRIR
jgi:hypothetical protein